MDYYLNEAWDTVYNPLLQSSIGYNPNEVWETVYKPLVGTYEELRLLDGELQATPIGDRLLLRMRTNCWRALGNDDVPHEWRKFQSAACPADLLELQRTVMHRKRSQVNPNICGFCLKEGTERRFQKCGRCLSAKYCSKECQHAHWPTHKPLCRPPEPKVAHELIFIVPACPPVCAYFEWYAQGELKRQMGDECRLMLEDRHEYEEAYGPGSVKRCLLHLALSGKPSPRVCSILYEKESNDLDYVILGDELKFKIAMYRGRPSR